MRILIVSDSYPPLIGGATRNTQDLARELKGRGHDVLVATSWQVGCPARERNGEIEVVRVRAAASRLPGALVEPRYTPPPFPDPELVIRLRRLVRAFRPNLIHSYGWITGSIALATCRGDVPLVVAARDYGNICARRTLLFKGTVACDGPRLGKCLGCASMEYGPLKGAVATISVLAVRNMLRRRIRGLQSVSTFVERLMETYLLPSGFDSTHAIVAPDWHPATDLEDPSRHAELPDEPFILFVGALRRIKGIEQLLDAYAELRCRPPLVLIGTTAPDTPPIPPDVRVLHDVPRSTVMAAWRRSLFGVAPSTLPEPLGNVVHEAMSAGRPMIGTFPGGHGEMIKPGLNGMLVPSGNVAALNAAMQTLIDDPELRRRLGAQAAITARHFRRDEIAPRLIAFIESVASDPESYL